MTRHDPTDAAHLRTGQYATGANLSARIALHTRFSTASVPFPRWLLERMAIPAGTRVLELGCGTGAFWRDVSDGVASDWTLVLTDFSEGMVRETREITATLACRVRVAVADAGALPFADGSAA